MCAMSSLNPMTMNHLGTLLEVHEFTPHHLYISQPGFYFRSSGLRTSAISNIKLETQLNFSKAHNLLTSVHL
jgi:hypothetical protein